MNNLGNDAQWDRKEIQFLKNYTRSAHQLFLGVTAPQMVSDLYEMIISICRITFSLISQNFMQFGGFWVCATKYIIFGHFGMSGKLVLR